MRIIYCFTFAGCLYFATYDLTHILLQLWLHALLLVQAMEFGAIPIILQPTDPTRNFLDGKFVFHSIHNLIERVLCGKYFNIVCSAVLTFSNLHIFRCFSFLCCHRIHR